MKEERHQKILELVGSERIATQEELAGRLNQLGFKVTQATVSRDIRQLRLNKVPDSDGGQCYAAPVDVDDGQKERFLRVLKEGFISMDMAQNILVVKTVPGMAMAVAAALDSMEWNEIVGCIAGDDTIMCAVRTVNDTCRVMDKIRRIAK
jgi:transcriptional regulator of arginine metabolism